MTTLKKAGTETDKPGGSQLDKLSPGPNIGVLGGTVQVIAHEGIPASLPLVSDMNDILSLVGQLKVEHFSTDSEISLGVAILDVDIVVVV